MPPSIPNRVRPLSMKIQAYRGIYDVAVTTRHLGTVLSDRMARIPFFGAMDVGVASTAGKISQIQCDVICYGTALVYLDLSNLLLPS